MNIDVEQINIIFDKVNLIMSNAEFKKHYRFSCILNSDELFLEKFFNRIKQFVIKNDKKFLLIVKDPDPFEHYFKKYKIMPVIMICDNYSYEDYINQLKADPGGFPDDAIINNSDVIYVISTDMDIIYMFYMSYGVGIGYFLDSELYLNFIRNFYG